MEFRHRTYEEQVVVETLKDLPARMKAGFPWRSILPPDARPRADALLDKFTKDLATPDTGPVELDDCENAWCTCGRIGRYFALINVFKTVGAQTSPSTHEGGSELFVTVVMNYAGGTFISQHSVREIGDVQNRIVSILDWGKYFPEKSAADLEKFLASLAQSGIVPLSGLEGVWFMTGMFGRKRATIHVIQTVRGSAFTST